MLPSVSVLKCSKMKDHGFLNLAFHEVRSPQAPDEVYFKRIEFFSHSSISKPFTVIHIRLFVLSFVEYLSVSLQDIKNPNDTKYMILNIEISDVE